jgi:hypothetical protein
MTHAQSAALEAFEEAGVHGRIEEVPFARYFRRKADTATDARSASPEIAVTAHLCEVSRLEPPQESNRNPTWFSAEKAKQRLMKDRAPEFGAELARVVDRAVSRIQRLHDARNTPNRIHRYVLQEVRFEAFEPGRLSDDLKAALIAIGIGQRNFLGRRGGARLSTAIASTGQAHFRKLHQISTPEGLRRSVLRLGSGTDFTTETVQNITAIDNGRRATLSKPGNLPRARPKPRANS